MLPPPALLLLLTGLNLEALPPPPPPLPPKDHPLSTLRVEGVVVSVDVRGGVVV